MKVGTPVIVSNIPPLLEVVQNSGLFVDPKNKSDLCQKLIDMTNPKTRQKYSVLGRKQTNKFTWANTAKSVLKVFEKFEKIK
jgi:glycosyltransferase involved in cell wall biosynthesis